MDGSLAIEHNREALKRILLALFAMAGIAFGPHPGPRGAGEPRRTLPRRLHRAVLRLLRPAEAAARRLIIAAARGLTLPVWRPRQSRPWPAALRASDTGILFPSGIPPAPSPRRPFALPLFDPPQKPFRVRRIHVPPHLAPRISTPGIGDRRPVPPPPSADDLLDATRLGLRLGALAAALDDLPRHALRFARHRARSRAAVGAQRGRKPGRGLWPLRAGRPPGSRLRRRHEVHDILAHAHQLARWALEQPDTS